MSNPKSIRPSPFGFCNFRTKASTRVNTRTTGSTPTAKMPKSTAGTTPYTGIIRDALGRKYCIFNGKRVPCPKGAGPEEKPPTHVTTTSGRKRPSGKIPRDERTGRRPKKIEHRDGGRKKVAYFAIIFNSQGQILENPSDTEYGGFIWSVNLPPSANPKSGIQEQLVLQVGQVTPIGEVGEAKSGQGYFLFTLIGELG